MCITGIYFVPKSFLSVKNIVNVDLIYETWPT